MDSWLNSKDKVCPVSKMGQAFLPKSVLDVQVSLFSSYWDRTPKTTNLLPFLMSGEYKSVVELIRQMKDKAGRNSEKAKLPAITPSGVFNGREDNSLLKHSGLIQIDIDYDDNKHLGNFLHIKEQLAKIRNIAYCGLSVSGAGYFCLIPIAHADKHREHFKALQRRFKRRGLIIDPSCINVARLRGVSYDPDPYFNHSATVFLPYDDPATDGYLNRQSRFPQTEDEISVKALVDAVVRKGTDLTQTYKAWFELACSIANSLGEGGREYFHQLSQFYPGYSRQRTDEEFNKVLKKKYGYSMGTLIHHCKKAGILSAVTDYN